MKTKPLVLLLVLASIAFAVLMPPEAYPAGRMAVLVCATFGFLACLIDKRISNGFLGAGLITFTALLAHSIFFSVDLYRSLEFLTLLWTYYCLLGFFLYSGHAMITPAAIVMVALAAVVSGYGVYQYFWSFDQLYSFIAYSGSEEIVKVPALEQIASRRVFSTLVLPGTLWGFLVISLPFHAVLWGRSRKFDVLIALSAAMVLAAGFLTRSFGFVVGLFVLGVAWLLLRRLKMAWVYAATPLALAAIAGSFYATRREVIDASNPFWLRFLNWVSAWHIFATNPVGTGLNSYGIVYSQYTLPTANETQFAHNTLLQLLSELGYFAVIGGVAALVVLAMKAKITLPHRTARLLLPALIVWVLHNMIDINVYFGSVGLIGAMLIGLLLARPDPVIVAPRRTLVALAALAAAVAIPFTAASFVSAELQYRAKIELENSKPIEALQSLGQAKTIMPWNSSLYHESGEILLELSQKKRNTDYLHEASASFRQAIHLSPNKVGPHIGLALCLAQAGEVGNALSEIAVAQGLYPRSTYVQAITRLLEERQERIKQTSLVP